MTIQGARWSPVLAAFTLLVLSVFGIAVGSAVGLGGAAPVAASVTPLPLPHAVSAARCTCRQGSSPPPSHARASLRRALLRDRPALCAALFAAPDGGSLVGKSIYALLHPRSHLPVRQQMAQVWASNAPVSMVHEQIARLDALVPAEAEAAFLSCLGSKRFAATLAAGLDGIDSAMVPPA